MREKKKLPTERELQKKLDEMSFSDKARLGYKVLFSPVDKHGWGRLLNISSSEIDGMSDDEIRELQKFLYIRVNQDVGEKAIYRAMNKEENGWTDKEFEDFWDSKCQERLTMIHKESHDIENNATQRANNSTDKRDPPIMTFFLGFLSGLLLIKFISLLFTIIGLL